MKKHFVCFYTPGSFCSEEYEYPVEKWDINQAKEMAKTVKEKYTLMPYGFNFVTRGRNDDELDSRVLEKSPLYYLGGKIETIEEVNARNLDSEYILRENMRRNNHNKIIVNDNSFRYFAPLKDTDIILQWDNE